MLSFIRTYKKQPKYVDPHPTGGRHNEIKAAKSLRNIVMMFTKTYLLSLFTKTYLLLFTDVNFANHLEIYWIKEKHFSQNLFMLEKYY